MKNFNVKISCEMNMRWQTITHRLFQKKSQSVNYRKAIHQMVKNEGAIMPPTLPNNESKLVPFPLVSESPVFTGRFSVKSTMKSEIQGIELIF